MTKTKRTHFVGLLIGIRKALIILAHFAAIAAICWALGLVNRAEAHHFDEQESRQTAAHAVAETARQYGYPEDSAVIQAAQADWWAAQSEIEADLDLLTRIVWFEAGASWLPDRQQQLVACVVINRVADPRFPGTVREVAYQRGQYSCASRLYSVTREQIPARCYANAKLAAYGMVDCPASVVWQAGFRQGRGVYERIGNTYFCF